jgi:hypothetical protein
MSAASVAVIYADRAKTARVFLWFFSFFYSAPPGDMWKTLQNPGNAPAAWCRWK